MLPFVSCICVTRDREESLAAAISQWHAQSYPPDFRELVIVADGDMPNVSHPVQYLGPGRKKLGAKRNIAVGRSQGGVIMHWDDDDVYDPDRIHHQVKFLRKHPEALISGYHSMVFRDLDSGEEWLYDGTPGYAVGVSLCYWREAWEHRPFDANQMVGEDNEFQKGRPVATQPGDRVIVASIHGGNTNPTRKTLGLDPWRRIS